MNLTAHELETAILAAGLISADELRTLWAGLPAADRPVDAQALAGLLVERGLLTPFQAHELQSAAGTPLVLGDYVLLSKIGSGGMGQVFKARHRHMERLVAIKLLPAAAAQDAVSIKRFQREVKAAAKLTHPNIVQAHDASVQQGIWYLVMECVEGQDLSEILKQRGPLPVSEAVDCILQAARGLAYAHGVGVIHRDIKPANLLLDNQGVVKILDMGLARLEDAGETADQQLTGTCQVMGTVDYMAPEQAANTHNADARSDIYSLGCALFRLLTGENMYRGATELNTLMAHIGEPIPSLCRRRAEVPAEIDRIFRKMVAKQPADRYQRAADLVADLEAQREAGAVASRASSKIAALAEQGSLFAGFLRTILPRSAAASCVLEAPSPATNHVAEKTLPEQTSHEPTSPERTVPEQTVVQLCQDVDTTPTCANLSLAAFRSPIPEIPRQPATTTRNADPATKSRLWPVVGICNVALVLLGLVAFFQFREANPIAQETAPAGGYAVAQASESTASTTEVFDSGSSALKSEVLNASAATANELATSTTFADVAPVQSDLALADADFQQWLNQVAALSADEQLAAVALKLQQRNEGFDGKVSKAIDRGVVVRVQFSLGDVTDISPLKALQGLKALDCSGASGRPGKLSDLSPLAGMPLTHLAVGDTAVTDVSPLRGMRLRNLYLSELSGLTDLSPLVGMPLIHLACNYTGVADLSPLRGLPLVSLDCSHTHVADLSPLAECTNLSTLDVRFTKVAATEVAALRKALPKCNIVWQDPAEAAAP